MLEDLTRGLAAFAELPPIVQWPFVAAFAGLVGSFLNVCIWRIPRGESIVFPRSHCTACNHVLEAPDLVPVLSWVFLGGKCRHCGVKVPFRYMTVELVLIALWTIALFAFEMTPAFFASAAGSALVVALAGIALMTRTLRRQQRAGFTFLEILLGMAIFAIFTLPFLDIMRTGSMSASKNREYLLAYNLARERLEELRLMPVRKLQSDWEVYCHGEKLTDNIFVDEFGPLSKWGQDEKVFYENFSDVLTERTQFPESVQQKFERNYKRYYGWEYKLYPSEYGAFKRVTKVKEMNDPSTPNLVMAKITVYVTIDSKLTRNRTLEMSTIVSDRGL